MFEEVLCVTNVKKAIKAGASIGEDTFIYGKIDFYPEEFAGAREFNSKIKIGQCCLIASEAVLLCHGYPLKPFWDPIVIGDNCYIGWGALILPGSIIGNNCVIGARAVISKANPVPDWSLAIGNPSIVRSLDKKRHDEWIASRKGKWTKLNLSFEKEEVK